MSSKEKAHPHNATGLPIARQKTLVPTHLELRECHYRRALGLSSGWASLVSNLIDMGGNPHGR
jgi:hypothetical protein